MTEPHGGGGLAHVDGQGVVAASDFGGDALGGGAGVGAVARGQALPEEVGGGLEAAPDVDRDYDVSHGGSKIALAAIG